MSGIEACISQTGGAGIPGDEGVPVTPLSLCTRMPFGYGLRGFFASFLRAFLIVARALGQSFRNDRLKSAV